MCEFLNLGDCSTSTYDPLPPRPCKSRGLWWSWMSSSVSGKLEPVFDCEAASLGVKLWTVQTTTRFPLCCSVHTPVMCSSCVRSATSQDDPDRQEQKLFFTTMNFWILYVNFWFFPKTKSRPPYYELKKPIQKWKRI